MDNNLTQKIKEYLDASPQERDLNHGNLLLLKLSGNRITYNMIARNPSKFAAHIESRLQKFYNFRVRNVTHQQVQDMEEKVRVIVENSIPLAVSADKEREEHPAGRRPDHDSLPQDIQELFEKNLEILVVMRKTHKKLRELSLQNSPCPDSERYPFLKELISLDKKLHANWKKYDSYSPTIPQAARQ